MSHYEFAKNWVESIRTSTGRRNINRDDFVRMLCRHAERQGITKITKLRECDVDTLIHLACTPVPIVQGDLVTLVG